MQIINLCFVDDIPLFSRGDVESIKLITQKEYIGGVTEEIHRIIKVENCFEMGRIPFKYLGVPLERKKLSIAQCQPLIENMVKKINHWSTRLFSYAGRFLLVKSVVFS